MGPNTFRRNGLLAAWMFSSSQSRCCSQLCICSNQTGSAVESGQGGSAASTSQPAAAASSDADATKSEDSKPEERRSGDALPDDRPFRGGRSLTAAGIPGDRRLLFRVDGRGSVEVDGWAMTGLRCLIRRARRRLAALRWRTRSQRDLCGDGRGLHSRNISMGWVYDHWMRQDVEDTGCGIRGRLAK